MEKFDAFCDNSTTNQSDPTCRQCVPTTRRRKNVRTISDISNVEGYGLEKLKKLSVVEKYRSVYLKKYVKGGNRRRHRKRLFVIPVFHVSRRPDNPFNVKKAVQNLKTKQMTCPSNKASDPSQLSPISDVVCYSNLEHRLAKSRDWESIRYKYQLDYKEKLKMERENVLREYGNMKRMPQKQQRVDDNRPLYENMDERTKEMSRNVIVQNDQQIMNPPQRIPHRHIGETTQNICKSSSETQTLSAFEQSNNSVESMAYYRVDDGINVSVESVDLTKDCENSVLAPRISPLNDLKQMRLVRNERGNDINAEINRNVKLNDSGTVPGNLVHEIPKKTQREDFDFSIPYKESNILIKVMTNDTRNPIDLTAQQSGPMPQETFQYNAESKHELSTPKRESKANENPPEPDSSNKWLQYLQNILNRTCDPQAEYFSKKLNFDHSNTIDTPMENPPHTSITIARDSANNRPIQSTALIQKPPNVMKVNTAANSHPTNYNEPSSIGKVKQVRPGVSIPRVIKPKAHPSPYFRSDTMGNNLQYNDQLEDPIAVTLPVRRHSPTRLMRRHSPARLIRRLSPSQIIPHHSPSQLIPRHSPTRLIRRHSPDALIPDQPNLPRHMEYMYGNHPNYLHDFMVRGNRLPLDVPHPNLIGPPIYSPYDQAYMQYRNEMDRIPQPPFNPYMQHSMPVPQLNGTIGFLPPRPSGPGVYRYINPQQHIHPVWIYPHILER